MRKLVTTISILICVTIGACAQESDVSEIEAIDDAVGKLDEAFRERDAGTIKTAIPIKQDGQWFERFYKATRLVL